MKSLQSVLLALAISLVGAGALAGTVDSASVTTFQSGSTLSSTDMNTTINALVTAINDNAARVTALEDAAATQLDLTGREYCSASSENGLWVGNTPGDVGVSTGSFRDGVIFNSGGTFTLNIYQDVYKEAFPNFAVIDQSEPLGQEQGTWTLTGNILEIVLGDETQKFIVSKSGDVIVGGFAYNDLDSQGSGVWYTSSVAVLVEVDDSTNCNF